MQTDAVYFAFATSDQAYCRSEYPVCHPRASVSFLSSRPRHEVPRGGMTEALGYYSVFCDGDLRKIL